ncbi:MAG: hypothetical protein ACJ768_22725 [Gaiellaceae bacterium]
MKRALIALVVLAALSAASTGGVVLSGAIFTAGTTNAQTASAVTDFVPPTINVAPVIAKDGSTTPGFIAQNQGYRVYADVTDSGNPASGVNTVTANVNNVTGGSTSVALSSSGGPFVIGGHSYNYESAVLTSDNPLTEGSKSFSATAADVAGNTSAPRNGSVTIDNTGPTVSSIIAKAPNGPGGGIKAGDQYYVFANTTDVSPINTITADIHNITASDTSAEALSTCTGAANCTVGGTVYAYRAGPFTSDNTLTEGPVGYSVTATDLPGNQTVHNDNVQIDNTNPVVTAAAIQKTQGGAGGLVKQGGTYNIFANVTDASQVTVTADVSSITNGATSVSLVACSSNCTVDGVTYAYKTASQQTVANPKAANTYQFTVAATDAAGNGGSGGPFNVTVDNTAPTVTDVQTANNGATAGLMESTDTITYSFSEAVEPFSILTGWDGTSTAVTVNVKNSPTTGALANRGKNDLLTITASGGTVKLGSVQLQGDYVTTDSTFPATMVMSGSNVTVTLGTQSTGTAHTETIAGNMIITPVTGPFDLAANNLTSTTNVTESVTTADVEF